MILPDRNNAHGICWIASNAGLDLGRRMRSHVPVRWRARWHVPCSDRILRMLESSGYLSSRDVCEQDQGGHQNGRDNTDICMLRQMTNDRLEKTPGCHSAPLDSKELRLSKPRGP